MSKTVNYDSKRRVELTSILGVEVEALLKAVEVAGNYPQWETKGVSLKLDDSKNKSVTIFVSSVDNLDSSAAISFANLMSPLLFWTSYRVIDMFFEWLIESNGDTTPFQMGSKVDFLKQRITNYYLPSPMDNKVNIILLLYEVYEKMMHFRHALTHTEWGGINTNGDISFDFFTKDKKHVKQIIPFSQVIDLSYLASYSMDLVINDISINRLMCMVLDWLADRIQPIIGLSSKGLLPPLHEKIVYEIKQTSSYPLVINLKEIESEVLARANNRDCIFDLQIQANIESIEKKWYIATQDLPDSETFIIDHTWTTLDD